CAKEDKKPPSIEQGRARGMRRRTKILGNRGADVRYGDCSYAERASERIATRAERPGRIAQTAACSTALTRPCERGLFLSATGTASPACGRRRSRPGTDRTRRPRATAGSRSPPRRRNRALSARGSPRDRACDAHSHTYAPSTPPCGSGRQLTAQRDEGVE